MNDKEALNRREALLALAKLSAYTAPTVVTLLSASSSYAAGSCGTGTPVIEDAIGNLGGDSPMNQSRPTMDTTVDCGVA